MSPLLSLTFRFRFYFTSLLSQQQSTTIPVEQQHNASLLLFPSIRMHRHDSRSHWLHYTRRVWVDDANSWSRNCNWVRRAMKLIVNLQQHFTVRMSLFKVPWQAIFGQVPRWDLGDTRDNCKLGATTGSCADTRSTRSTWCDA